MTYLLYQSITAVRYIKPSWRGIYVIKDNYFSWETFNTSYLFNQQGKIVSKHRKRFLFPLGETGFFKSIPNPPKSFTTGDNISIFDIGNGIKIISSICYESLFNKHFQEGISLGGNLAVVQTSLRGFGNSPAISIHRSMTIFQAVKFQIPILFTSNNGMTSIILPTGIIKKEIPNIV